MILKKMRISILFLIFTFSYLHAYDPAHLKLKNTKPTELDGMELENKIGNNIPLTLKFTAETGEEISLSKFFNQGKPIVLSMVYYRCPTLCNYHLNGIAKVFKNLEWNLGEKYEFITVSIDPSETPDLAEKKEKCLYGRLCFQWKISSPFRYELSGWKRRGN
jgi:protein SCO1